MTKCSNLASLIREMHKRVPVVILGPEERIITFSDWLQSETLLRQAVAPRVARHRSHTASFQPRRTYARMDAENPQDHPINGSRGILLFLANLLASKPKADAPDRETGGWGSLVALSCGINLHTLQVRCGFSQIIITRSAVRAFSMCT